MPKHPPNPVRDSTPAIEICGVVKHFGETPALDRLELEVPAGSVYGLLGPNGAGKTTLIRILATLLRPDRGTARVLGHDVVREAEAVRSRISLTGQFAAIDNDLTGTENLYLLARLFGFSRAPAKRRAAELLEAFELSEASGRQVKTYSGGMRRRLDVAASIIVAPELLFLDEPTTGLDPHSRNHVWEVVRTAVASGTTVLLTTQHLDEADQLAERIAVIDRGRLIAEGSPGSLKASIGAGTLELRVLDPQKRADAARLVSQALDGSVRLSPDASALTASVTRLENVGTLFAELQLAGIDLTAFAVGQPRLDEVFFALTGRPAQDGLPEQEAA